MSNSKLTILWHSVAPFIRSGYGKCTNYITRGLAKFGHRIVISAYYGVEPGGVLQYADNVFVIGAKDGPFGIQSAAKFARLFDTDIQILFTDWWAFCWTEDTEILTKDGWKTYDQLKETDLVATFSLEKNKIEFQPIIEKLKFDTYINKLYRIKSKQLDFVFTEGHNLLCKNWTKRGWGQWRKIPIESIKSKTLRMIPVSAECSLNKPLGLCKELLWLLGFIIAEGSFVKSSKNRMRLFIYQSTKHKDIIQKLRDVLNKLGIKFHEYIQKPKPVYGYLTEPVIQFQISAKDEKWIEKYFKSLNPKILSDEILYCSKDEFETILEGWIDGDGMREKSSNSYQIVVKSDDIKDFLQIFCILHGYRCTYKRRPNGTYLITISNRNSTRILSRNISLVDFKCPVWGIRVPNGTVVIRRNGRHMITGNSAFPDLMPYPILYGPMDHCFYPEEIINFTRKYKRIISLCYFQQKELKERWNIDSDVIYHGVDTNIFKPLDKKICKQKFGVEDKFVFGTVAANSDKEGRKSWAEMIKAFHYFLEQNSDVKDIKWLVHTNPTNPLGLPLMSMVHKWGLDDIVKFMDPQMADIGLTEEQLCQLYNAMDVHILCSKREGFGVPILESMACGVPNICHNFSSMTELVEGRGWLVKSLGTGLNLETTPINAETAVPDVYDIADKISRAYFKENERKEFGERAREFAIRYNWDDLIANKWIPLLEKITEDFRLDVENRRVL